jgi:hypothetical protein
VLPTLQQTSKPSGTGSSSTESAFPASARSTIS